MTSRSSIIALKKKRLSLTILLGSLTTLVLSLVSLQIGASPISLLDALMRGGDHRGLEVILGTRAPRAVTAIIVGSSLSVAGAVMQNVFRNPLADPYITGVASGAAFTASLATLFGVTVLSPASAYTLPLMSFIGGMTALCLTMIFGRAAGGSSTGLLLSGVAVSFLFSAATTILISMSGGKTLGVVFWLFGSLITSSWRFVYVIAPLSIAVIAYVLVNARKMNVMLLGDDEARQLGINVSFLRWSMIVSLSLLTSTAVAFHGIIGFIGLVAPHISRMVVGEDHRLLIPSSIFVGSCIILFADLVARTVISPGELPIGAITSMIGAPFLIFLLANRRGANG